MAESKFNTNFIECVNALDIPHFKRITGSLDNCKVRELYINSYSSLIRFTQDIIKRPASDATSTITALTHMVYGWMPTMLDNINYEGINFNDIFEELKSGRNIDISGIAKLTNGSVVGASKLLHFVYPDKYPIFDSRVYRGVIRIANVIEPKKSSLDIDDFKITVPNLSKKDEFYQTYQEKLEIIARKKDLEKIKRELENKRYIDKDASNIRALEVCLYAIGAGFPKENDSQKERKENIIKLMKKLSGKK